RVQFNAAGIPGDRAFGLLGTNGSDGSAIVIADYQGRRLPALPNGTVYKTGLLGFEQVDEIAIVIAPAHHTMQQLTTELISHCTALKDRFAILHSNPSTDTLNNLANIRPP